MNESYTQKILNWKWVPYGSYQVLTLKIIEKPCNCDMVKTQCQVQSLDKIDDSIYLHDSLTGTIKPGLGGLLVTKIQPREWLVVIY